MGSIAREYSPHFSKTHLGDESRTVLIESFPVVRRRHLSIVPAVANSLIFDDPVCRLVQPFRFQEQQDGVSLQESKTTSLREMCRRRIVDGMIKQVNGNNPLLFVALVCDNTTLHLVSSVLSSADLVANRVAVVDKLEKNREPLMNMDAIYFLCPTAANIQKLTEDFPDLSKFKPKYRKQHVFLNSTCPDDVMAILTPRKDMVKAMSSFVELNLDFVSRDDRVFHFNSPTATMLSLFPKRIDQAIEENVTKLDSWRTPRKEFLITYFQILQLSVCACMHDKPIIRFQKDSIDSYCSLFATALSKKVDEYWAQSDKPPNVQPCVCLIVDRSIDAIAPFIHDFGYEALCMDLLGGMDDPKKEINTRNDTFSYDTVTEDGSNLHKSIVLNDDLWRGLRHKSMLQAKDIVMMQMVDLKENNDIAKFMQAEEDGIEQEATAKILRQLPAYQEKVGKYGSQLTLITRTMKLIQELGLNKIGRLEQDIACAIMNTGEPVNVQNLMVTLAQTLMDTKVPSMLKMRLLLVYVLNMRGVSPAHREKMLSTAGFNGAHRHVFQSILSSGLVDDLEDPPKLQIHETRTPVEEQLCYSEMIQHDRKQGLNPTKAFKHELFRFQPRIRMLAQRICTNTLDNNAFPFVKSDEQHNSPLISLGRQNGKRPRVLIYFIGGVTYSETRSVFDLSAKYNADIFMGSEHIINPSNVMEEALARARK